MTALIRCRDHIKAALVAEQEHRSEHLDWIERERVAVAIAACEWAEAHGLDVRPTVADVGRIERSAVGHVDYTSKLALHVAEFVCAGGVCEYRPTTGYRCTLPAGHPTLEPHHVERTTNLHTCPTCTRKVALVTGNTIETHTAPGHPYGPVCPTSGQLLDETHGGAL